MNAELTKNAIQANLENKEWIRKNVIPLLNAGDKMHEITEKRENIDSDLGPEDGSSSSQQFKDRGFVLLYLGKERGSNAADYTGTRKKIILFETGEIAKILFKKCSFSASVGAGMHRCGDTEETERVPISDKDKILITNTLHEEIYKYLFESKREE